MDTTTTHDTVIDNLRRLFAVSDSLVDLCISPADVAEAVGVPAVHGVARWSVLSDVAFYVFGYRAHDTTARFAVIKVDSDRLRYEVLTRSATWQQVWPLLSTRLWSVARLSEAQKAEWLRSALPHV